VSNELEMSAVCPIYDLIPKFPEGTEENHKTQDSRFDDRNLNTGPLILCDFLT